MITQKRINKIKKLLKQLDEKKELSLHSYNLLYNFIFDVEKIK